jgi:hypothetical protein
MSDENKKEIQAIDSKDITIVPLTPKNKQPDFHYYASIPFNAFHNFYRNYIKETIRQACKLQKNFILSTNNKNSLQISSLSLPFEYRKYLVSGLTISAFLFHYVRNSNQGLKFRWLIPYYFLFSVIFCRENLDPYH